MADGSLRLDLFGRPPAPPMPQRGRGATPLTKRDFELPKGAANPAGRRRLHIEFRPLHAWQPVRLEEALCLIELYFTQLGGLDTARDSVVRSFYGALEHYTADELRWAIEAKAESLEGANADERRLKRSFLGSVETFCQRAGLWVELSPQFQERKAALDKRATTDHINEMMHRRVEDERASAAGDIAVIEQRNAARKQAAAEKLAADEQRRRDYWDGLSAAQRTAAVKAVQPQFKTQCANYGWPTEDPQADDLLRSLAINWATFMWPPQGVSPTDQNAQRQQASAQGVPA